jgi:hypothetical protein
LNMKSHHPVTHNANRCSRSRIALCGAASF